MRTDIGFHEHDPRPRPSAGITGDGKYTWLWMAVASEDTTVCITVFRDTTKCREIAREMIRALDGALAESEKEGGAA